MYIRVSTPWLMNLCYRHGSKHDDGYALRDGGLPIKASREISRVAVPF